MAKTTSNPGYDAFYGQPRCPHCRTLLNGSAHGGVLIGYEGAGRVGWCPADPNSPLFGRIARAERAVREHYARRTYPRYRGEVCAADRLKDAYLEAFRLEGEAEKRGAWRTANAWDGVCRLLVTQCEAVGR